MTPHDGKYPEKAVDRFWRNVQKADGCWLWMGYRKKLGYGTVNFRGKTQQAHRVAYEAVKGPIPAGLVLDHLCRNPSCVNPDHLEAVTPKVNTNRGLRHVPKTVCKRGHPLDAENTYINKRGKRRCKACNAMMMARYFKTTLQPARRAALASKRRTAHA